MFEPHAAEQPFFVALTQSPDLTHSLTSDRDQKLSQKVNKKCDSFKFFAFIMVKYQYA